MVAITVECPHCGTTLKWWPQFYYVQHRIRCRCGQVVTVHNPRIGSPTVSTSQHPRLCLECQLPLPPMPENTSRAFRLSWTCPTCWDKHRIDEPAENLGNEVGRWLKTRKSLDQTHPVSMISQTSPGRSRGNGGPSHGEAN